MKKNFVEVEIRKNALEFVLYIRDKGVLYEMTIDELVDLIEKRRYRVVQFETIENDRVLLSGYFIYKNKDTIYKQLKKAAKAQLPF